MRRLALPAALALAVVSCATESVEPGDSTTTEQPPGTSSTDPATTSTASTTTIPPGPPVAWLAPNGVPMAVTEVNGETIEVLTPCGVPFSMVGGAPVYEVQVVIDPGHGGPVDTGAVAPTGLAEKEINLKVSLEIARLLEERGISTMLTRIGDYPIPIRTRADYSDLVGAAVLVSIHHNAPVAPASTIPGVEIFVQQGSGESQRLGGLLYDSTMASLSTFDVDWDRSPDAGVMTVINPEGLDAYGMVRLPDAPSALLELGFIANRAEAEIYLRPEYVPTAALSVADAIETYLTSEETGAQLVEGRVFRPNRGVGRDRCVDVHLDSDLYPDVTGVDASQRGDTWRFNVTMTSPYDSPERYADAFRVVGDDGVVYGERELLHDHAKEQPFTRALTDVEIPETVSSVTVEGRDLVYGWGGGTVTVDLE